MTRDEFLMLQVGDLIRHPTYRNTIVVTANYGDRVTAVRTFDVTNPDEWELVAKSKYEKMDL